MDYGEILFKMYYKNYVGINIQEQKERRSELWVMEGTLP